MAFIFALIMSDIVPLSSIHGQGPDCDKCIRWVRMFNASLWVFPIAGKSK